MTIPEQIRRIRQAHHLSLAAFGRKLGVTGQCISYIEAGKRLPSMILLEQIAESFTLNLTIQFTFANGEPIT